MSFSRFHPKRALRIPVFLFRIFYLNIYCTNIPQEILQGFLRNFSRDFSRGIYRSLSRSFFKYSYSDTIRNTCTDISKIYFQNFSIILLEKQFQSVSPVNLLELLSETSSRNASENSSRNPFKISPVTRPVFKRFIRKFLQISPVYFFSKVPLKITCKNLWGIVRTFF